MDEQRKFFSNWGEIQFCVQRLTNWSKRSIFGCNAGYKLCPNKVCVDNAEKCPLNNLMVMDDSEQYDAASFEYIWKISASSRLLASRSFDADFIVDINVGINGIPCIFELETTKRTQIFWF